MAIAYSIVKHGVTGTGRYSIVDITLDGSYAAGGYALTAASCGLSTIYGASVLGCNVNLLPAFDTTNTKLKMLKGASSTTVTTGSGAYTEASTNDTYLSSTSVVRLCLWGEHPNG